jgi:hypothetical protein
MAKTTKNKTTSSSNDPEYFVECEYAALFMRTTPDFGVEEMWIKQKVIYGKSTPEEIEQESVKYRLNLPDEIMTKDSGTPYTLNRFEGIMKTKDTKGNPIKIMGFEP